MRAALRIYGSRQNRCTVEVGQLISFFDDHVTVAAVQDPSLHGRISPTWRRKLELEFAEIGQEVKVRLSVGASLEVPRVKELKGPKYGGDDGLHLRLHVTHAHTPAHKIRNKSSTSGSSGGSDYEFVLIDHVIRINKVDRKRIK